MALIIEKLVCYSPWILIVLCCAVIAFNRFFVSNKPKRKYSIFVFGGLSLFILLFLLDLNWNSVKKAIPDAVLVMLISAPVAWIIWVWRNDDKQKDQETAESNREIAERNQEIAERNQEIAERNQEIIEADTNNRRLMFIIEFICDNKKLAGVRAAAMHGLLPFLKGGHGKELQSMAWHFLRDFSYKLFEYDEETESLPTLNIKINKENILDVFQRNTGSDECFENTWGGKYLPAWSLSAAQNKIKVNELFKAFETVILSCLSNNWLDKDKSYSQNFNYSLICFERKDKEKYFSEKSFVSCCFDNTSFRGLRENNISFRKCQFRKSSFSRVRFENIQFKALNFLCATFHNVWFSQGEINGFFDKISCSNLILQNIKFYDLTRFSLGKVLGIRTTQSDIIVALPDSPQLILINPSGNIEKQAFNIPLIKLYFDSTASESSKHAEIQEIAEALNVELEDISPEDRAGFYEKLDQSLELPQPTS